MHTFKKMIKELGQEVKEGKLTWQQATDEYNRQTEENITSNAMRKRFNRVNKNPTTNEKINEEYETHYKDGTVEVNKEVFFDPNEKKTPEIILKKFGYDPNEFELVEWRFGKWEVAIKDEEENRVCTTIRAKIRPKKQELSQIDMLNGVKEVLKNLKPINLKPIKQNKMRDTNKMIESPGIELHLGKRMIEGDVAEERFYEIIQKIIDKQQTENTSTLLVYIGNDFFNSEANQQTTKGTPQHNTMGYKEMFDKGTELYLQFFLILREHFNNIDVKFVPGNHDSQMNFFLYRALEQAFKEDNIVNFDDNINETQVYVFGEVAIFSNHGDFSNGKALERFLKSLVAEFYEEIGKTRFREAHLGHLHSEYVLDDDMGIVLRRVTSPSGVDEWHLNQRYIGSMAKYQLFTWHKNKGLLNIEYLNFESKKKLIKRRKA